MAEQLSGKNHNQINITIDRRAFVVGGGALAATAAAFGFNRLLSDRDVQNQSVNGNVPSGSGMPEGESNNLAVDVNPTESTSDALVAQEGDIAMVNPSINRMPSLYAQGETTPERFLEVYDDNASDQARLRMMFQLPNDLLRGREGEHGAYLDAVVSLLGNATKPGQTQEELMEFMRPEFFADKTLMNSDQLAALEAEIESAIDSYVEAMVSKYTDAIFEGGMMINPESDRTVNPGYKMLVQLRRTSLRQFAEHVLKYKNANWIMGFRAANRQEDVRGEAVGIDADLTIGARGWSSDEKLVTDVAYKAQIGFMGESTSRGVVGTAFRSEESEEYKSFMQALDQISQW